MEELTYTVHIEPAEEGGYIAYFPALPGCHTQGETLDEVIAMAKEVLGLYLESLQAHGEPIPQEKFMSKLVGFDARLSAPLVR